jgi:hypothetical protein
MEIQPLPIGLVDRRVPFLEKKSNAAAARGCDVPCGVRAGQTGAWVPGGGTGDPAPGGGGGAGGRGGRWAGEPEIDDIGGCFP